MHEYACFKGKAMDSFLIERNLHFKYSTLEKATNFFDDSNKLGQGGFGEVYKVKVLLVILVIYFSLLHI